MSKHQTLKLDPKSQNVKILAFTLESGCRLKQSLDSGPMTIGQWTCKMQVYAPGTRYSLLKYLFIANLFTMICIQSIFQKFGI